MKEKSVTPKKQNIEIPLVKQQNWNKKITILMYLLKDLNGCTVGGQSQMRLPFKQQRFLFFVPPSINAICLMLGVIINHYTMELPLHYNW